MFTDVRFGGNPLAVLPDAVGLSSVQMQQIAREFNFSESAFVLPSYGGYTRNVRIFKPTQEIPFAGHPNIGAAFVLLSIGEIGNIAEGLNIVFEEKAGPVPISIRQVGADIWCELKAPEPLSLGQSIDLDLIAAALSLVSEDIITSTHQPIVASVGLPFIIVELNSRLALERARSYPPAIEAIQELGIMPDILLYVRSDDDFDIRARVFAPLDGVPEDPATGSANCALAALLSHYKTEWTGDFSWRIAQGVEMKRPSVLEARSKKWPDSGIDAWVSRTCKMVTEGLIEI